jgi:PAS domain S-box-containing protein
VPTTVVVTEQPSCDDVAEDSDTDRYVSELEQYRRRLDGAMFAGDLAWWEMDVDSGAVDFHENKVDVLGYSPADFDHYEDFTDLVHPDDHDRMMQSMRDHLQGEADRYDVEYRIRDAAGEYQWFHDVGGVTERDSDGSPRKVTGIVVDITRRKRVEQDLRRKNEQFGLLNRIVRHDIRNDMSVIDGWIELLREDLPPEYADRLDRIHRASQHTTELTEAVRDVMELIEGSGDIDLQPVSLHQVLTDEVERVRASFDQVEIRTVGDADVRVRANAMLSSVFGNLLNNAVHHNDEETARVTVETERENGTVRVHVADNGPGVPEERRLTLFERETKGLESAGTGLGLYLVETLVTAYGGDVWVTDNEPKGAVFVVELQRA